MTMVPYYMLCQVCRGAVDPADPAVATFGDDQDFMWVPFVEDLRTSSARLIHPVCFATAHGVEALVAVVHRHDDVTRRTSFDRFARDLRGEA
jgi:hypothetical protein